MARYLVVAHQTAESPELLTAVSELAKSDPEAEFVILIPATPLAHLLVWEEGKTQELARRAGEGAQARFEEAGLRVSAVRIGDPSPLEAINDEMLEHPGYRTLVISTLPPGLSRWLKLDPISRITRRNPSQRVIHVVAQPGGPAPAAPKAPA